MVSSVATMIDLFNRENIKILQNLGYQVSVACNFQSGNPASNERLNQFKRYLEEQQVSWYQVDIPRSIFRVKDIIHSYRMLKKYIEKEQFDVIHCHSPIGGVVARLAARKSRSNGTKVMYTAHGFHFYHHAPLLNWVIFYPIEKICSRMTDYLITINQEDYDLACKRMKAKHIEYVLGVGVNTSKIASCLVDKVKKKEMLGINPKKRVVLGISELSARKNCMVSIQAFYQAKLADTVLYLCGQGPQEEQLRQLVKQYELEDDVIFGGYRTDIHEVLSIADVFLFPSKQEGLPVALMEAMAAGLPVVGSKIRGNVDLIEDYKGGFLYEPMDVNGFSAALQMIFSNSSLAKSQGEFNRQRIKAYDCKNINVTMERLYKEVTER